MSGERLGERARTRACICLIKYQRRDRTNFCWNEIKPKRCTTERMDRSMVSVYQFYVLQCIPMLHSTSHISRRSSCRPQQIAAHRSFVSFVHWSKKQKTEASSHSQWTSHFQVFISHSSFLPVFASVFNVFLFGWTLLISLVFFRYFNRRSLVAFFLAFWNFNCFSVIFIILHSFIFLRSVHIGSDDQWKWRRKRIRNRRTVCMYTLDAVV